MSLNKAKPSIDGEKKRCSTGTAIPQSLCEQNHLKSHHKMRYEGAVKGIKIGQKITAVTPHKRQRTRSL